MLARILISVLLLLAFSASAQTIPSPVDVTFLSACEGEEFILRVSAFNFTGENLTLRVRRTGTAPDLLGEQILLEDVVLPYDLEDPLNLLVPDPGVGPGDIGYYEAEVFWPEGTLADTFTGEASCTDEPLLMRGYLLGSSLFQPCTGQGLLECSEVTLLYGDMNLYVGTWNLLEIHGWPTYLNGVDHCSVLVTSITPLGVGALCEDVVGVTSLSWDGLKARYR